MRRFDLLNRRTHLYLGMFVMPWLIMYGASSFMLNHPEWFRAKTTPQWQPLFEREYQRTIPESGELREVANQILRDCQLEGAFWVQRSKPQELEIHRYQFRKEIRVIYFLEKHRLRAEQQTFNPGEVVIRLHFRGGFQQPSVFDDFWAILVDIACAAIFIWIASGVFLWWKLARLRVWGAAALAAGVLSFVVLLRQL